MGKTRFSVWDGPYYQPDRDGTLEEYLTLHDGHSSFPLFKGSKQFYMLWDQGYMGPLITTIRVMWNVGRGDEHFNIIDRETIEGIDAPAHAGRPGKHPVRILDGDTPSFEIHYPQTLAMREFRKRREKN